VLAVIAAARDLCLPIEVRALMPLAENMIGPSATRPGDVATAWNGTRIRIMDTDFEGRVLMADALALGSSDAPDVIIDVATLTYQVAIGLGNDVGGFFTTSNDLGAHLADAGHHCGEPLWRLPLVESYLDQVLTSDGVKNHPESDVGRAITAALFLRHFVQSGVAWAHLDLTGPAWRGPASADGATGFGVRTLITLLEKMARD
jgi:leucyl aminopeptidase